MFDVKKALEKLIMFSKEDAEHCNNKVTRCELMAILEAGHSEEVDEFKPPKPSEWNNENITSVHIPMGSSDVAVGTKIEVMAFNDKPSECVSIPRSVAEEWLNDWDNDRKKTEDMNWGRLNKAIRESLKQSLG